jgi:hypothetical protein
MANQRDLKAFVRYDGSGRVVAGSLVLRKKKPKVGRWEEILTYECCNPTTSTTTTGAPTVYDYIGGYGSSSAGQACFGGMTQTYYSTTPYGSITNGTVVYSDAGLTTPIVYPYVSFPGLGIVFQCSNGVLSNQANCS